jgi:hypothetical protein
VVVGVLAAILGVAGAWANQGPSHEDVVREIEVRQAPLEKQVDRIDANVQWLVEREMDKQEGK